MIWLFKVEQVYWDNKPKVNEHYLFDVNDIEFDITQYEISLYSGTNDYYLIDESNDTVVYWLHFGGVDINPTRILKSEKSEIYNVVRNFYKQERK